MGQSINEDGTVRVWCTERQGWIRVQLQVALEMAAMDLAESLHSREERDRWATLAEARLGLFMAAPSYATT